MIDVCVGFVQKKIHGFLKSSKYVFFLKPLLTLANVASLSKKLQVFLIIKITYFNFLRKLDTCVNADVEFVRKQLAQLSLLRQMGAHLQPCVLKNHYSAPHIKGAWRLRLEQYIF